MQRQDFYYELPSDLVARYPLKERSASRLLYMDCHKTNNCHLHFSDLIDLLRPDDLLVFNDTKVIPARLLGKKESGGQVEILLERVTGTHQALGLVKASKAPKTGTYILLENDVRIKIGQCRGSLYTLEFISERPLLDILDHIGHVPLPPYLNRLDETLDRERYQTIYAKKQGAVAAPTAGLHFDTALFAKLAAKKIEVGYVTLHVGLGTFQPVRVENIADHQMHKEYIEVSAALCEQVAKAKAKGGRVIAVGTTSVRCLETASANGQLQCYQGDTDIFIYPGYSFQCIDGMITNFHLPESTLIMLVCAFAGRERVMQAYREAVAKKYRFFSYGDAMLILK